MGKSASQIDKDAVDPAPWARGEWTGELVSIDGCDNADFTYDDVEEVIAYATTPDEWDGENAGIARLKDGRFIAWECAWGPTGNGFSADAYGGTADIAFAKTEEAARGALSERATMLLDEQEEVSRG